MRIASLALSAVLFAGLGLGLGAGCKSSDPADAAPKVAPEPPANLDSPERAAQARALARSCMTCHAEGNAFRAPVFGKAMPRTGRDPKAIYETIRNGVPGTAMLGRSLPDDVIWDLVSWVRAQTPPSAAEAARAAEVVPAVAGEATDEAAARDPGEAEAAAKAAGGDAVGDAD